MGKVIDFNIKRKKKGKIYIATHKNYFYIDADLYLLCTTYTDKVPDGTLLVEELSPSFKLYLIKKALLKKRQFVNRYNEFVSAYRKEIASRKDYIKALERLTSFIEDGKKVVLFDDCNLKEYCHLNILGQELIEMGYKVDFFNNNFVNFNIEIEQER